MKNQRDAALALLNLDPATTRLTRRSGAFLGQLTCDPTPMSVKQLAWLEQLLKNAGLPAFEAEAGA